MSLFHLNALLPVTGISVQYMVILGVTMLLSFWVSSTLKRRFAEYSEIPFRYTGAQIAEEMLRQNGIYDVQVISVEGQLTDHYDPTNKTVNLSEPVYHMNSVAAAAVATHECGHAIQHAQSYDWLLLRSKMVPIVSFSSKMLNALMLLAFMGMAFAHTKALLWVWVAMFGVTTLFSLVTLPVEFDASRRALRWLESSGLAVGMEQEKAKNALHWAAMTYVVAALGSVAQLLYYLGMALNRRD